MYVRRFCLMDEKGSFFTFWVDEKRSKMMPNRIYNMAHISGMIIPFGIGANCAPSISNGSLRIRFEKKPFCSYNSFILSYKKWICWMPLKVRLFKMLCLKTRGFKKVFTFSFLGVIHFFSWQTIVVYPFWYLM